MYHWPERCFTSAVKCPRTLKNPGGVPSVPHVTSPWNDKYSLLYLTKSSGGPSLLEMFPLFKNCVCVVMKSAAHGSEKSTSPAGQQRPWQRKALYIRSTHTVCSRGHAVLWIISLCFKPNEHNITLLKFSQKESKWEVVRKVGEITCYKSAETTSGKSSVIMLCLEATSSPIIYRSPRSFRRGPSPSLDGAFHWWRRGSNRSNKSIKKPRSHRTIPCYVKRSCFTTV